MRRLRLDVEVQQHLRPAGVDRAVLHRVVAVERAHARVGARPAIVDMQEVVLIPQLPLGEEQPDHAPSRGSDQPIAVRGRGTVLVRRVRAAVVDNPRRRVLLNPLPKLDVDVTHIVHRQTARLRRRPNRRAWRHGQPP